MRKIESLFISGAFLATVLGAGIAIYNHDGTTRPGDTYHFPTSKYGAFIAAQHAIYVNDFGHANEFMASLDDVDYKAVQTSKYISEFLSGHMPADAAELRDDKTPAARFVYDAYLVNNDDWDALYKRHKSDESALVAPFRIWSAVQKNRITETMKFIDKLPTNASWKSFVRGQIYAEIGKYDQAATEFAKVRTDFMNVNDYMYIMSFYTHHDMNDAANKLRADFTSSPGGMYMLQYTDYPAWETISGYKNAMAFSIIQNVSHTQIMMYSDLALLMLRFAQITAPGFGPDSDIINYYMGQFLLNNDGNFDEYFNRVDDASPFAPFVWMRRADTAGDARMLRDIVRAHPLFAPGVMNLVLYYTQHGDMRHALRTLDSALKNDDLPENGRAFFMKMRAQVHYAFGKIDAAAHDIKSASEVLPMDADIMLMQAKIWAAQNRNLDDAYEYAMSVVRRNPSDTLAWDAVGVVVAAREGLDAGLAVLARVGDVSSNCSLLFMHLGDMYAEMGDNVRARDAYIRAIDLSSDGLVSIPVINKKIRKLK